MLLLRLFIDICLLRVTPQELPAAPILRRLTLFAYLVSGLLVLAPGEGVMRAAGMVMVDAGVMLALLAAALHWRRHPARFDQAATALLGTGALLGLLLLPVLVLGRAGESVAGAAFPLWLALFLWGLVVSAHILRHALELPMAGGMLAAVVYFSVSLVLIEMLFPGAT
jgi:hypothetical protein